MKKVDKTQHKRLEKGIVKALILVCEQAKYDIAGFAWLTHTVDYSNFPASLCIICVFEQQSDIIFAQNSGLKSRLIDHIVEELQDVDITLSNALKNPETMISFDSEDNGATKRYLS